MTSPAQTTGWTEDPDVGDGRRGWFRQIGPWALGVVEHPGGHVTWGVSGPDEHGEHLDTDGTAPSVEEAQGLAIGEVRRRWEGIGEVIRNAQRLGRCSNGEIAEAER